MKIEELRNLCDKQDSLGLNNLVLNMPAPKSWFKNGPRGKVRTPFGLCVWSGGYHDDTIVIFPTVDQVRGYIEKVENQTIYAIVSDSESMTVSIHKMKEKDTVIFEGHPHKVIVRKFYSEEEAYKCLMWATKELG